MQPGRSGTRALRDLARAGSPADILALAADAARAGPPGAGRPELCGLVNAKSGACPEDCAWCAQAASAASGSTVYGTLPAEAMIARAKAIEASGADHACLVASGRGPTPAELAEICRAAGEIRRTSRLSVCACLGVLAPGDAGRLRDAGVVRYNHNLETSERFFPFVCRSHTWRERWETALDVGRAGLELCCGGILGMGETEEDRLDLLRDLRALSPRIVPLNFLNPRPGTPMATAPTLSPLEALKYVALFRIGLPGSVIKLAGGREGALRSLQGAALLAGATGLVIGGYLTTAGRPVGDDLAMLADAGAPAASNT